MALRYCQSNTLYLAGSGVIIGATSVVLTTFSDIYANVLTMTDFGVVGYITLEPDTTNEEAAQFTGVTANANGTYTLTGVSTLLAKSPYTATSGLVRAHSGGTKVVITDNVAFWNTFGNVKNTNTWDSVQTFSALPTIPVTPLVSTDAASKDYVDNTAVAGAPNASTTVKGIVELATQIEFNNRTTTGGTGALLVVTPDTVRSTKLSDYQAESGQNVTMTIASPAVISETSHGLSANDTVTFTTTGALPTGISPSTVYYVIAAGLTSNAYEISATLGGAAINTSGTQSGIQTAQRANTYVITVVPNLSSASFSAGQTFSFKASNANTRASTLTVATINTANIVNPKGGALVANDILAGMMVTVEYDGTSMVMQNPVANTVSLVAGAYPAGDGSAITNLAPTKTISSFTAGPAITAGQPVSVIPYQSDGGILVDTAANVTSSNSYSFTVASNSNRGLVVFVHGTGSASSTQVTYAGVTMTQIDTTGVIGSDSCQSYYLNAPTTGSNTLVITMSSGTAAHSSYYSLYNVKQSAQPEAHTQNFANPNITLTLSTIADGAMMLGGATSGGSVVLSGTGAYANVVGAGGFGSADSGQVFPAAQSISLTATTSTSTAACMLSIAPATVPVQGTVSPSSSANTTNQFYNKYNSFVGFANSSVSTGQSVSVTTSGVVTGLSSLSTIGKGYYLADSAGTISSTVGTNSKKVGVALSATTLVMNSNW